MIIYFILGYNCAGYPDVSVSSREIPDKILLKKGESFDAGVIR